MSNLNFPRLLAHRLLVPRPSYGSSSGALPPGIRHVDGAPAGEGCRQHGQEHRANRPPGEKPKR